MTRRPPTRSVAVFNHCDVHSYCATISSTTATVNLTRDVAVTAADNLPDHAWRGRVQSVNWLARPVPLHATSTGKAWLAWLPEPEVRGVLGPVLEGFTDATVTDVSRLLGELAQIRERGYAVSAGELEPALCGVSAPVLRRREDRPLAVFSIWGPADRMPPSRFEALGAVAIEAAPAVEAALGD